jgi:hypothetical protein
MLIERTAENILQILPHIEPASRWLFDEDINVTLVQRVNGELCVQIKLPAGGGIETHFRRLQPRTLPTTGQGVDSRELALCSSIISTLENVLPLGLRDDLARRTSASLADMSIAHYLEAHHGVHRGSEIVEYLKGLSRMSYESKPISQGLLIERTQANADNHVFPVSYDKKKYRALSNGYRTAYLIGRGGKISSLIDLSRYMGENRGRHYYPEWSESMARASVRDRVGFALNRHGDILFF